MAEIWHASEPRSLTEGEIGWIAGLVDGEGCVGLMKVTGPLRLVLRITMTDRRAPDRLQALVGGTVQPSTARPPRQPAWCWYCRQRDLPGLLRILLPHLVVKREEVEAALEYFRSPLSTPAELDRIRQTLRQHKIKRVAATVAPGDD